MKQQFASKNFGDSWDPNLEISKQNHGCFEKNLLYCELWRGQWTAYIICRKCWLITLWPEISILSTGLLGSLGSTDCNVTLWVQTVDIFFLSVRLQEIPLIYSKCAWQWQWYKGWICILRSQIAACTDTIIPVLLLSSNSMMTVMKKLYKPYYIAWGFLVKSVAAKSYSVLTVYSFFGVRIRSIVCQTIGKYTFWWKEELSLKYWRHWTEFSGR